MSSVAHRCLTCSQRFSSRSHLKRHEASSQTRFVAIIKAAQWGSSRRRRNPDAVGKHATPARRTELLVIPVFLVLRVRAKASLALTDVLAIAQMGRAS
ncbi:hypothetical protein N7466_005570 [Penicillium verhagenii]|uniref:uncharacterized protein n=1 Tax=Penicillium verhagenii TaxID=1562060 RepID=UPI0025452BA0|nr:uncharacterized protein N7466_005570 [Penicillium verhagenii]KAJ5930077.1 hypothetical protein N7466_005570 [Penicillium verhagenii]